MEESKAPQVPPFVSVMTIERFAQMTGLKEGVIQGHIRRGYLPTAIASILALSSTKEWPPPPSAKRREIKASRNTAINAEFDYTSSGTEDIVQTR